MKSGVVASYLGSVCEMSLGCFRASTGRQGKKAMDTVPSSLCQSAM